MRILKNRTLEARWNCVTPSPRPGPAQGQGQGGWDRAVADLVMPPRLAALVGQPIEKLTTGRAFDVGEYVEPGSHGDADTTLLLATKAACVLGARLEPVGAFRVLVRRHEARGAQGQEPTDARVTLRCFARDDSHPRTPDDLDEADAIDCVLFVDTRRIDGARRK